jgi:protein phosphatase
MVRVCAVTDPGRARERNEDHYCVGPLVEQDSTFELAVAANGRLMRDYGLLVAVADGMGGVAGGCEASSAALHGLCASFYASRRTGVSHRDLATHVTAAAEAANQAVVKLSDSRPELRETGSTLAGIVLLAPDVLVVFHVGDSRVVRLSAGFARCLTVDHSLVGPAVAEGRMTEQEALAQPGGAGLTRALGVVGDHAVEIGRETEWRTTDRFAVGSDGWWGLGRGLPSVRMEESLSAKAGAGQIARAMAQEAVATDGQDNVTTVVVCFEPATESRG